MAGNTVPQPSQPEADQGRNLVNAGLIALALTSAGTVLASPNMSEAAANHAAEKKVVLGGNAVCGAGNNAGISKVKVYRRQDGSLRFSSLCETGDGDLDLKQELVYDPNKGEHGEIISSYTANSDNLRESGPPRVFGRFYSSNQKRWLTFMRPQQELAGGASTKLPAPLIESATVPLTLKQRKIIDGTSNTIKGNNPIRFVTVNPYGQMSARIK